MLREILEREEDLFVVGEAATRQGVMEGVAGGGVDVLITSLSVSGAGAGNLISELKTLYSGMAILVLTMHPEDRFAAHIINSGASAFLTKDVPPEEIVNTVRAIMTDGNHSKPGRTLAKTETAPKKKENPFTRREVQILKAVSSGRTISEIALELAVTAATLKRHFVRISRKARLKTIADIEEFAVRNFGNEL